MASDAALSTALQALPAPLRITFVGHVCVDENVVAGVASRAYGGGVVHGAITAARLGARTRVLTRCAAEERPGFAAMLDAGVDVVFLDGDGTTSIRNVYPTDNPDDRTSYLLSQAEPFTAADLGALDADIVHVNPLAWGELAGDLLESLRPRVATLGLDAQGMLRRATAEGRLGLTDWPDKRRLLPLVDVFKTDIKEAAVISGYESPSDAAAAILDMGPATVVLTHARGVHVRSAEGAHDGTFGPYGIEGRTGRGDTCTASFLVGRAAGPLDVATALAARVTTAKMQYAGPYRGD